MLHTVNATAKNSTSEQAKRATSFEPEVAACVGAVIRRLRESTGIAQDVIPLLAQVDRSYYGKLERGERQPSIGVLLRIASALGTTAAELIAQVELTLSKKPSSRSAAVAQAALDEAKRMVAEQRRLVAKRAASKKVQTKSANKSAGAVKSTGRKRKVGT
jgi:transcriptional regulator with XRE-family HTH domain